MVLRFRSSGLSPTKKADETQIVIRVNSSGLPRQLMSSVCLGLKVDEAFNEDDASDEMFLLVPARGILLPQCERILR
jgi:hypothetical protein